MSKIVVHGLGGNDTIWNNTSKNSVMTGDGGSDTIHGGNGTDQIYGGTNNDFLYGGNGNDDVYGEQGNDYLYGASDYDGYETGNTNDTLQGGDGSDHLYGGYGNDVMVGGNDNDWIQGQWGDDMIAGANWNFAASQPDSYEIATASNLTTNDTLFGENGNDTLFGGDGDDDMSGGFDNDSMHGEDGNDHMYGAFWNSTTERPNSSNNDTLWGGEGNDTLQGGDGRDWLWCEGGDDVAYGQNDGDALDGGSGNDYLDGGNEYDWMVGDNIVGGEGDDTLHGQAGPDTLHGGDGNDKLYGDSGFDQLSGDGDNDWLDAGSIWEYADGGDGTDFNAYVTSVNGTQYADISQGSSNTCWIAASMGALARTGYDLSQRITYVGNDTYAVSLFNRVDPNTRDGGFQAVTEYVTFDGSVNSADPNLDPAQEGESWTIIMQRAVIQAVSRWDPSQSITSPHSGGAQDAMAILNGDAGDSQGPDSFSSPQALTDLLNSGKSIVVDTSENTDTLVASHSYTVIGGDDYYGVQLYNPWGQEIWISWSAFRQDVSVVVVV